VLENAIEPSKLTALNAKMIQDAYILQERGDKGPYNYNKGLVSTLRSATDQADNEGYRNIQQDPPLIKKFFEPNIFISNTIFVAVLVLSC
jgi:hypothetical protein